MEPKPLPSTVDNWKAQIETATGWLTISYITLPKGTNYKDVINYISNQSLLWTEYNKLHKARVVMYGK